MKKVTWIISDINKSHQFEGLLTLLKEHVELSFVLINMRATPMDRFIMDLGCPSVHLRVTTRFYFLSTFFRCVRFLKANEPDVVHCHLQKAGLIGLLAARVSGINKRIYTRHHSTFHHQYARKGVWLDRVQNLLATDIVAISRVVEGVLCQLEGVSKDKVHVIHHGFRYPEKEIVPQKEIGSAPVIGVISRAIEWKGIQYVLPAFQQLLEDYPSAVLVVCGVKGPFREQVDRMLRLIPAENIREIAFSEQIEEVYQMMDIYVHVPVNSQIEAFGQTYVEALAAGKPCVFTKSGIANEFIEDGKNALVVPYRDSKAIEQAIRVLLANSKQAHSMALKGQEVVRRLFRVQDQVLKLHELYEA